MLDIYIIHLKKINLAVNNNDKVTLKACMDHGVSLKTVVDEDSGNCNNQF
jgi:hypothetical protein